MTTMTTLPRPGGLTALAVLNIVFALLGMLGGAMMHAMNDDRDNQRSADQMDYAADHISDSNNGMGGSSELSRAMAHGMAAQMRSSSPGAFRWMMASGFLGGVLLLVSGVGFLGQKRYTGRYCAIGAGIVLAFCASVAVVKLGFLYWGFPMLGGGYALTMMLLAHFMYRPALQR